jgi:hypothetical protein
LTLHPASKVFEVKAFAKEKESLCTRERERKKNLFLGYITPPFGLFLPSSSNPGSVGWQKCNNTSSLW